MTEREPTRELQARIAQTPLDPKAVAVLLDGLDAQSRAEAVRALGRDAQRRLYAAVDRFLPLQLRDLVPAGVPDQVEVRHEGRNTLPLFTRFEKRFCRPAGEEADRPTALYGYNFQTLSPLTGPGYFVAVADAARGEVLIDYRRVPREQPPGWPPIRPNEQGLSRYVYGFMVDTLRRVSEHVTIGSAARKGRDIDSWFVLCRRD